MSKCDGLKRIFILFLMFFILITLSGCKDNRNEENIAKEKIEEEVEYLDKRIISMMNIINNVSFSNYKVVSENVKEENNKEKDSKSNYGGGESESSQNSEDSGSEDGSSSSQSDTNAEKGEGKEQSGDNEQNENKNMLYKLTENNILDSNSEITIQWNEVKKEVENLYTIWTTMVIDMRQAKIANRNIEQFSRNLDKLAKTVKDQNKQESLSNLSDLYSILPKFLEENSSDSFRIALYKTKSNVLNAYSIVSTEENWNGVEENLRKVNDEFKKIEENNIADKNKRQNITKASVLLQDLDKSIETKDKEIFFLRYKNLMQELNML